MTGPERQTPKNLLPGSLSAPLLIQLGLIACLIAVFFPVCTFDFINYDDNINVYENDRIVDFSIRHLLYFWQGPYQGLYIPITYTVWGLLAKASSLFAVGSAHHLQPALFHTVNLLLHGASVVLLCQILRRQLNNDWAAGAGALLFALHPVQVEAVAWVTGLKDVLSGLFSLLALRHYLSYAAPGHNGLAGRTAHYGWAALFFGAAMLSKPSAVAIPFVVAVLSHFLLRRKARQLIFELGPWLLFALSVVVITKISQPETKTNFIPALWQRFLVAGDAISFYLGKLVLPLSLAPGYGRSPEHVLAHGWVYGTGLLPYLLAILLIWKYRQPWALAAAGIFTAAILPVLGFIPFEFQSWSTVADRYLYMAMLGPALALAWGVARCQKIRIGLGLGVGVWLVLMGVKSAFQVRHWQDSITFNSYAVEVNPQNSAAYNNLGIALKEANRPAEATAAFQRAMNLDPKLIRSYNNQRQHAGSASMSQSYYKKQIETDPSNAEAYFNLGDISRDNSNMMEALSYYQKGLELKPDFAVGFANLGLIYVALNNTEKAIAAYLKAIEIDPGFAEVYSNLGSIYEEKEPQQAVKMFEKALAINPALGEAANNLGFLYLGMNREKEAIPLLQQAIAAYPDNPLPHNNLGLAYFNLGQFSEAAASFQKAITAEPSFAPALNNLSKAEIQLGDIPAALDHADKAKALGYTDPEHFKALEKQRR